MPYQSTVLADAPALYWRLGEGPDAAYRAAVLADAPTAYWPLTQTPAGAGTAYPDATGHGYDAALLVGTATASEGPIPGTTAPWMTVTWDGINPTSDAIWTATTAGLPADGDPYTVEGWIRPRVWAAGGRVDYTLAPFGTVAPSFGSYIAWGPQNYTGPFLGADTIQNFTSTTVGTLFTVTAVTADGFLETWDPTNTGGPGYISGVFDRQWHHIAISDDAAGTLTFYLDGVQVYQATGASGSNGLVADPANVLFIGDPGYVSAGNPWPGPAQEPFDGGLAHVALYLTALSSDRILAHYAARRSLLCPDSSGHGHTGRSVSGVTPQVPGLLRADANTAAHFNGTAGVSVQDALQTLPAAASIEVWLRTTTTAGGVLAQFATADGTQRDLTLYLRTDGVPAFRAGDTEIVRSPDRTVADGRIHHLVATLDADAAAWLYVDGNQVAHQVGVGPGSPFTGRWQIGAGTTDDLAVPPLSAAYAGTIDEVAIYQD